MPHLEQALINLSEDHREALDWFHDRAGVELSWPEPRPSGIFLVNKAKGIHKPAEFKYALSIRQSLKGPYQDHDIQIGSDGKWSYRYFQEGKNPAERDKHFTNRALMQNIADNVPVGVMLQTKEKPDPRYKIIGLAQVTGWEQGYFTLEGYLPSDAKPDTAFSNAEPEQQYVGIDARASVREAIQNDKPELTQEEILNRSRSVYEDTVLLARCASSKCLITYATAIALRGHGNPQNGRWLDEVYKYAITPLVLPDLTLLVVNKATTLPSPDIYEGDRTLLSKVHIDDIPLEQKRCCWFEGYSDLFGELLPIPTSDHLVRLITPEPAKEREIARAVANAINRILGEGQKSVKTGKAYLNSLSRAELAALVDDLWSKQNGRCALTKARFDLRKLEEGGVQDDRISIDRIDNSIGYASGNIQLTTQFANRARGTLSIEEAKKRLVQCNYA